MKKYLLQLFLLHFVFIPCIAQNDKSLDVGFINVKDTIYASSSNSFYVVKIKISKQKTYANPKIILSIDANNTNVKGLMVPSDATYTVEDTSKDIETEFRVSFTRDTRNDRTLVFKLKAEDADGKELKLADEKLASAEVYIKPFGELENADNEYWLFVGANFDLLDGIKARDLYFRGSFLIPINNANPRKHQLYITFEKNRFFSERDSLYRIPFSDMIFKPGPIDSITITKGQYNSFREITTENLGFSLSYIRNINSNPGERFNFYTMAGFYIDYQNKMYSYANHSISSDTTTYLRQADSAYIFRPLHGKDQTQSWNSNLYLGFMYIHSGVSVNLKTFLQAGINFLRSPVSRVKTSTNDFTQYGTSKNLYIRYHLDATLLESPGVSLGCEVYYRAGIIPLFNFTLTKVFDYRQIKNLFNKVPAQ